MMCKSATQETETPLENGVKAYLNGRARSMCPRTTCLLKLYLAPSPFLGLFIDKQQAGSVEGIKGLHRAESCFDKYTLPSENPGGDTVVSG